MNQLPCCTLHLNARISRLDPNKVIAQILIIFRITGGQTAKRKRSLQNELCGKQAKLNFLAILIWLSSKGSPRLIVNERDCWLGGEVVFAFYLTLQSLFQWGLLVCGSTVGLCWGLLFVTAGAAVRCHNKCQLWFVRGERFSLQHSIWGVKRLINQLCLHVSCMLYWILLGWTSSVATHFSISIYLFI